MITLNINPSTFDGDNNPKETQVEDIVLVNPNENWYLYNHGSLELTKEADKQYLTLWDIPNTITNNNSILIVGGGDGELACNLVDKYCIDLVDPYVHMYSDFHKFYTQTDDKYNKLIFNTCFIPKTFNDFYKHYDNKRYYCVLTDVSEPDLNLTNEIYCESYFEKLSNIKSDYYMMYIPPTMANILYKYIRKYFNLINIKSIFIIDWNQYSHVALFSKHSKYY